MTGRQRETHTAAGRGSLQHTARPVALIRDGGAYRGPILPDRCRKKIPGADGGPQRRADALATAGRTQSCLAYPDTGDAHVRTGARVIVYLAVRYL